MSVRTENNVTTYRLQKLMLHYKHKLNHDLAAARPIFFILEMILVVSFSFQPFSKQVIFVWLELSQNVLINNWEEIYSISRMFFLNDAKTCESIASGASDKSNVRSRAVNHLFRSPLQIKVDTRDTRQFTAEDIQQFVSFSFFRRMFRAQLGWKDSNEPWAAAGCSC